MLPKKRKIERSLFSFFIKNKSFQSKNVSLKVCFSDDSKKETKFSFVVSKKVSNLANKRNLLKRRGYHIVENIKNIKKGFICIFYFKKSVINLPYKEIKEEVIKLLKESSIVF